MMVVKQSVASADRSKQPPGWRKAHSHAHSRPTGRECFQVAKQVQRTTAGGLGLLQAAFCTAMPMEAETGLSHLLVRTQLQLLVSTQHLLDTCALHAPRYTRSGQCWTVLGRQLSSGCVASRRACRQLAGDTGSSMLAGGQAGCRDMSPPACGCSSCAVLTCGGSSADAQTYAQLRQVMLPSETRWHC